MKKTVLLLMVIALIGTLSCNGGKSVDTDTLCAEKVAAAVQAACDSIRSAQPVRETKIIVARVTGIMRILLISSLKNNRIIFIMYGFYNKGGWCQCL